MTKKTAPQDAMEELHKLLAETLAAKIRSGDYTAADLGVARQFLRDNKIDATAPASSPLDELKKSLPFPTVEAVRDENSIIQ